MSQGIFIWGDSPMRLGDRRTPVGSIGEASIGSLGDETVSRWVLFAVLRVQRLETKQNTEVTLLTYYSICITRMYVERRIF